MNSGKGESINLDIASLDLTLFVNRFTSYRSNVLARLACMRLAASVQSEP